MRLIYIKDKVYIFILLLALISSGCNGYLVEKNPSEVTTDFLYSTADGLQSAVNGLYTIERAQVSENESSNFANIMGDGGTDIDFNRAAAADISRYRTDIDLTLQGPIRSWWQKWYRIIERTNSIISFGEAAALTDKEKKVILREAYTYRAYAYFWLVRKFDNIWLNIEPTTYQNIDGRTFTAAKQEDVYKQIIADLDKAIDYYATDWTVIQGRFNQGVARLLRADVAMWLKDYQTAATQSEKIITDGPFALESPDKIFLMDRKNSTKESMYVMQFDEVAAGGGPAHRLPLVFTPTYRSVPGCISVTAFGGYGWARIFPNPYLIGLYNSKYDQAFVGFSKEGEARYGHLWKAAVDATAVDGENGLAITIDGAPISVFFSSSTGGTTQRAVDVWGTDIPHLISVPDPWSIDPAINKNYAKWTKKVSQKAMAKAFGLPDVERYETVSRTATNSVLFITGFSSSGQSKTLTVATFKTAVKLPSSWFDLPIN